jgi:hypothetical protein
MARYVYRTHKDNTLTVPGHAKTYTDGDPITLSKGQAETLARRSRLHRFEEVQGDGVIDQETAPMPPAQPARATADKS